MPTLKRRRSIIRGGQTGPSAGSVLGQGLQSIGRGLSQRRRGRKKEQSIENQKRLELTQDINMFEEAQPLEELYKTSKEETKRLENIAIESQRVADQERLMTFGALQDISSDQAREFAKEKKVRETRDMKRDLSSSVALSSYEHTQLDEAMLARARSGDNIDTIFSETVAGHKEIDDRYASSLSPEAAALYYSGTQSRQSQNAESFMRSLDNARERRQQEDFRGIFGKSIDDVFASSDFTGELGPQTISNIVDSARLYTSTSQNKEEDDSFIDSRVRAGIKGIVENPSRVAEGYSILDSGAMEDYFTPGEITAMQKTLASNRDTIIAIDEGEREFRLFNEIEIIQGMLDEIPPDTPASEIEGIMSSSVNEFVDNAINDDGSKKYSAQDKETLMSHIPSIAAMKSREPRLDGFNKSSNGRELSSRVNGLSATLSSIKKLTSSTEKDERLKGVEELAVFIRNLGNLERDPSFSPSNITRDKRDSERVRIANMKMSAIKTMADMEKAPGGKDKLERVEDMRLFPRIEKLQSEILFPTKGSKWELIDPQKRTDISSLLADSAFKMVEENMTKNGKESIDIFEGNIEEISNSLAEQAKVAVLGEGEQKALDNYKPVKKIVEDIEVQNMALQRINMGENPNQTVEKISSMLQEHAMYSEAEAIDAAKKAVMDIGEVTAPSLDISTNDSMDSGSNEDIISELFEGPILEDTATSDVSATIRLIAGEENGRDRDGNPLPGKTVGYVPAGDNSGVTIASGLDLGDKTKDELIRMGIPEDLAEKLDIFTGLKGVEADRVARDLVITEEESDTIDNAVIAHSEDKARRTYEQKSGKNFNDLTDRQRAVLASITHHYGSLKATPKFLGLVSRGDWDGAISELRYFGDNFDSRRNREADFIEGKLN